MNRVFCLALFLCVGCCPDLKPTVAHLRDTIRHLRVKDYEGGRVKFSDEEARQKAMIKSRRRRMLEAERLAGIALEEKGDE